MRKATLLVLALVMCLAIAAQSAEIKHLELGGIQRLGQITRSQLLLQLNKQVQLEGFFYDGSIPMVVQDMDTVRMDKPMPPDSYVPIVGPRPTGLAWGAKIRIQGQIQRPTSGDPHVVQGQSLILRISGADKIQVVQQPAQLYNPLANVKISSRFPGSITVFRQDKFAVLIAGGYDSANSHLRYWHDLVAMYNILKNAGYKAPNIYVVYADGARRDTTLAVDAVLCSATKANISNVFTQLASKMDSLDTLYIMLNDHGGNGTGDPSGDETTTHTDEVLWLWNAVAMTDDEFAVEMNKIQACDKIIMQMKQCYGGGYIDDTTKPNRIIMSASSATQVSYGRSANDYGEFTFWYFAALTGNKPDGSGSVNADANNDGKVSIMEAWNFARAHDSAPETPFYEDNGVKPAHSGAMPAGGEGVLGAATFL